LVRSSAFATPPKVKSPCRHRRGRTRSRRRSLNPQPLRGKVHTRAGLSVATAANLTFGALHRIRSAERDGTVADHDSVAAVEVRQKSRSRRRSAFRLIRPGDGVTIDLSRSSTPPPGMDGAHPRSGDRPAPDNRTGSRPPPQRGRDTCSSRCPWLRFIAPHRPRLQHGVRTSGGSHAGPRWPHSFGRSCLIS
jgi:hypothetical protein